MGHKELLKRIQPVLTRRRLTGSPGFKGPDFQARCGVRKGKPKNRYVFEMLSKVEIDVFEGHTLKSRDAEEYYARRAIEELKEFVYGDIVRRLRSLERRVLENLLLEKCPHEEVALDVANTLDMIFDELGMR